MAVEVGYIVYLAGQFFHCYVWDFPDDGIFQRFDDELCRALVEVTVDAYHHALLAGDMFGHFLAVLEIVLSHQSFLDIHHCVAYVALGEYDVSLAVCLAFDDTGKQADGSYEDGYLLVPEGGGALIRFNNGETKFTGYYADVYGYDYGIKRTEFITESKASFPVFGILRNEQSFFCSL